MHDKLRKQKFHHDMKKNEPIADNFKEVFKVVTNATNIASERTNKAMQA